MRALHILVSKHFYVVEKASTSFLAARVFPQQASGVDQVSKEDRRRDVAKKAEDYKLHTQRKRALVLVHRSRKNVMLCINAIFLVNLY